jgi:hypothetical protein
MDNINSNCSDWATGQHFLEEKISCFINISGKTPAQISLKQWFSACILPKEKNAIKNKEKCLLYRDTGLKDIKRSMGTITPGAIMVKRDKNLPDNEQIERLTGWMQFDIDPKDNPLMKDAGKLRDELKKIVYVAYCSISASGKGVWGLIKVKSVENYKLHFEQLKRDFAYFNIKLDTSKGGNPTDMRIYSFDPDAYVAERFKIYDRINEPVHIRPKASKSNTNLKCTNKDVEKLIKEIQKNNIDITPNYPEYLSVAFAFANEFAEQGRAYFHSVCSISEKYSNADADLQFDRCLSAHSAENATTIASFFYLCREAGMSIKTKK